VQGVAVDGGAAQAPREAELLVLARQPGGAAHVVRRVDINRAPGGDGWGEDPHGCRQTEAIAQLGHLSRDSGRDGGRESAFLWVVGLVPADEGQRRARGAGPPAHRLRSRVAILTDVYEGPARRVIEPQVWHRAGALRFAGRVVEPQAILREPLQGGA
jgi:hypothetical protein